MIFENPAQVQNYKLLTQYLIPRPIAWISTINSAASVNLAPFGFFGVVSLQPTILSVCFMKKTDGSLKDTLRNILDMRIASVSIPSVAHAAQVQDSGAELPFGVSEAANMSLKIPHSNYPPIPSDTKFAMFCEFFDKPDFQSQTDTIFLKVNAYFLDDEIYKDDLSGEIDALARAGRAYKCLREIYGFSEYKPFNF